MLQIRNIRQLITCAGAAPRRGAAQRDAAIIHDGAIVSDGERIVFAGSERDLPPSLASAQGSATIDGRGLSVVPGFVDAHTHAMFAGDRRDELRRRLGGATYAEIAARAAGSSRPSAPRAPPPRANSSTPRERASTEMLACGTTTAEVKSGYGLDVESELKMLRAIRTLSATQPIDLVPTFMGAHEIPVDYRSRREDYVRLVIDEMIPAVAKDGLAEWCDVFCETGVFTPEESTRILEAGAGTG